MLELADSTPLAHCMFEYVYFARPDSTIDNVNVYQTRLNIGKQLYEQFPIDADVVIPVPDSSIPAAIGYSRASGITYGEGLIKTGMLEGLLSCLLRKNVNWLSDLN